MVRAAPAGSFVPTAFSDRLMNPVSVTTGASELGLASLKAEASECASITLLGLGADPSVPGGGDPWLRFRAAFAGGALPRSTRAASSRNIIAVAALGRQIRRGMPDPPRRAKTCPPYVLARHYTF